MLQPTGLSSSSSPCIVFAEHLVEEVLAPSASPSRCRRGPDPAWWRFRRFHPGSHRRRRAYRRSPHWCPRAAWRLLAPAGSPPPASGLHRAVQVQIQVVKVVGAARLRRRRRRIVFQPEIIQGQFVVFQGQIGQFVVGVVLGDGPAGAGKLVDAGGRRSATRPDHRAGGRRNRPGRRRPWWHRRRRR